MPASLISLLHATRGRVDGAATARERWLVAADNPQLVEHVFAFDRDDEASVAGLGEFRHVVVEESNKGCVAAWNLAARSSSGRILVQLSDDWLPIAGWDTRIIERFRDLSRPGVLKINDGRRVDDLLCMAIFTRPWLEEIGGDMFSPEYFGVYSDDEFSFRAYDAGVVIDARDIMLTHVHPNYDVRVQPDDTHRRQNDDRRLAEGRNIFLRRNPRAVGRWIHDWTDCRYYLPDGHLAVSDAKFRGSFITNKQTIVQLAATQESLDALINSLSWRLTKPLRFVQRLFGRSPNRTHEIPLSRRIYQASPLARALKRLDARLRSLCKQWCFFLLNSRDNALSHDGMVKNRRPLGRGNARAAEWPFVDISFVTFNSARWIRPLLESLWSQDYPIDKLNIVFVDHGSTDDTIEIARNFSQAVSRPANGFTVLQQSNMGYGAGHHRAIIGGKYPWLLISNVDLEFNKKTLTTLLAAALADDVSIAGWEPRQAPFEHPKHYDPVSLETSWQSHACVLIRRSAYEAIGGYDPLIFMYGEDVELSYRLRSHGYKLRYCPQAVVTHHAYADPDNMTKPLQLAGSMIGNIIVRFRYGLFKDKAVGAFLLVMVNVFHLSISGSSLKTLRKESLRVVSNLKHFLTGKGPEDVGFPIRAVDFELRREGSSWRRAEVIETALVSIITRTHGAAHRDRLLEQAGASVLNQTYGRLEWIVVEDGGETCRPVVERLVGGHSGNLKWKFFVSNARGRSAAGNFGLQGCSGDYCMFLDDDDLLYADHVETLLSALQLKSAAAAYALAFEIQTDFDGKGQYIERQIATSKLHRQPWDYAVLKEHNFIPIQAILFERSLFEQRGGFDTSLDQLEDWNLWLRYGYRNSFRYVPKTTSIFRTPADAKERARRQEALHKAYFRARDAAFAALRDLGYHV